ncbi:unnamed protein product [Protopolystoma xenopodis]|uniref:Uncharacterized protein n=1 Tax=Protopolystoma xenopodis TaxID=117903 RepID=A0A3S4ZT53_9PLAT|nr:unnamed protein product [Protopolystoma xenopodis]
MSQHGQAVSQQTVGCNDLPKVCSFAPFFSCVGDQTVVRCGRFVCSVTSTSA